MFIFSLFSELEGRLEGLFCEEDGGGGGDGGGDEVEGCLDLAVGVAEAEVFDEGEESGKGVVEGVGGGADDEEGVEGCEEGDVEVGVRGVELFAVFVDGERWALVDGKCVFDIACSLADDAFEVGCEKEDRLRYLGHGCLEFAYLGLLLPG